MKESFAACLDVVLASEGGFTESLNDGSIATNLGVTLNTWSGWIGHTATIAEIEALTKADVAPLYRAEFWGVAGCDDWQSGIDLMVFDTAVNAGPARAIRTLQSAVGAGADGIIGPATRAAVAAAKPPAVIETMAQLREAYYKSLPNFSRFGNGWLSRVSRTAALAQQMVGQ